MQVFGQPVEIHRVQHRDERRQADYRQDLFFGRLIDQLDRVRQTRGFDQDHVRLEHGDLLQGQAESAADRATDAAVGHFADAETLAAQQLAVDVDLAILVHHHRRLAAAGEAVVE